MTRALTVLIGACGIAACGLARGALAAEHAHPQEHGADVGDVAGSMRGHMNDDPLRAFALADRLEWRSDGGGDAAAWDVLGWIGKDANRLWLRSEGERSRDITEGANLEALWGKPVARWWDLLVGLCHDFEPGAARTWAAFGVTGLAPYGFETQLTAYVDGHGATLLQAELEYELLLTQRWILQPRGEAKLFGRRDAARSTAAGLAESTLGLRLRYELRREFAPYAGVEWTWRGSGYDDQLALVAGIRAWL